MGQINNQTQSSIPRIQRERANTGVDMYEQRIYKVRETNRKMECGHTNDHNSLTTSTISEANIGTTNSYDRLVHQRESNATEHRMEYNTVLSEHQMVTTTIISGNVILVFTYKSERCYTEEPRTITNTEFTDE